MFMESSMKKINYFLLLFCMLSFNSYSEIKKSYSLGSLAQLPLIDQTSPKLFILAVDGGGIRGVIPATIAEYLEKITGKPLYKLFNLAVGSSTGGLISLGLAMPDAEHPETARYSAKQLKEAYIQKKEQIFDMGTRSRRMWKLDGHYGPKFKKSGIRAFCQDNFGDNIRLSNLLIPVVVTSYDTLREKAIFFSSVDARNDPNRNYLAWQAARATSAAPTYFKTIEVKLNADKEGCDQKMNCMDAGIFVLNPALEAFWKARKYFPDIPVEDIVIVSLGTGYSEQPMDYAGTSALGKMLGGSKIFKVISKGQSSLVEQRLSSLLGKRYIRLQATLDEKNAIMENIADENVAELISIADQLIIDNEEKFAYLVSMWEQGRYVSNYDHMTAVRAHVMKANNLELQQHKEFKMTYNEWCRAKKCCHVSPAKLMKYIF
jgi:patatin-like phospholipase/acyl hydrolase